MQKTISSGLKPALVTGGVVVPLVHLGSGVHRVRR
jgi:hypothetical protein